MRTSVVTEEHDLELCILSGGLPYPIIQQRMPKGHHNDTKRSVRSEGSEAVPGTIPAAELADHKENQRELRQDPAAQGTLRKCCSKGIGFKLRHWSCNEKG